MKDKHLVIILVFLALFAIIALTISPVTAGAQTSTSAPAQRQWLSAAGHVFYNGKPVYGAIVYWKYASDNRLAGTEASGSWSIDGELLDGPMTLWAIYNGVRSENYTTTPVANVQVSHDFYLTGPAASTPQPPPVWSPEVSPSPVPNGSGAPSHGLSLGNAPPSASGQPTSPANDTQNGTASGETRGSPFPGVLFTLLAVIGGCALLARPKK